jgi:hypothetical protein
MGFLQWLENAISFIRKSQDKHETIGQAVRKLKGKPLKTNAQPLPELNLTKKIIEKTITGKVCGVDSGFAHQSFHSLDLMMLRTIGVCFEYEEGKLKQTSYFPKAFDLPQPIVDQRGLEREEFGKFVSLTRLQSEIENAIALIEKFKPQTLFLDGSLIPHPADKPNNDSELHELYQKVVQTFEKLYQVCEEKNCLLIGSVEDSRSTRLSEIIREELLPAQQMTIEGMEKMHDSPLMDKVLQAGERSMVFSIGKNHSKHPILMDINEKWKNNLFACYIKPSRWDFPLRIEFFKKEKIEESADLAAGIASAQSSFHREYAYPSVLIEADLRAGLKPEEISMVSDQIFSKLGRHTIHHKRRDKRPF